MHTKDFLVIKSTGEMNRRQGQIRFVTAKDIVALRKGIDILASTSTPLEDACTNNTVNCNSINCLLRAETKSKGCAHSLSNRPPESGGGIMFRLKVLLLKPSKPTASFYMLVIIIFII